ncbi:MAG: riboflavin synthase [Planctomycetota bacterium]|nr:riboflavin synthase [Planctomycetota bacterium]MDG2143483.1 riboflavin synthase [Planctomycetota bacterium]
MFTGLVEAAVPVRAVEPLGTGLRIVLEAPPSQKLAWRGSIGESIAVSGCCLTLVESRDPGTQDVVDPATPGADMVFDLSAETVDCTWFGELKVGDMVNLERALALGDRLGGHVVSGHVDGRGSVHAIEDSGDGGKLFTFSCEDGFERYLVPKGSVTVDGISLTVVRPGANLFSVAIIPETLRATTLGSAKVGAPVHLESDPFGKWVEQLIAPYLEKFSTGLKPKS